MLKSKDAENTKIIIKYLSKTITEAIDRMKFMGAISPQGKEYLLQNEKTARYFTDIHFNAKWSMCESDP